MKGEDLVANALIRNLTPKLETAKRELNAAYNWQPDYLSRYSNQKEDMVLVQVVDCRFSLLNPKLKIRQEGPASFIFSADGLKLLKSMKVGDCVLISPNITNLPMWIGGIIIDVENNPFRGIVISAQTMDGNVFFSVEDDFKILIQE